MNRVTLRTAPEIARVIRAADPTYRKQAALMLARERVMLSGTSWYERSCNTYHAVDLRTLRSLGAPQYAPPQYCGRCQCKTPPLVSIPDGVAIVKTGIFQGKTATATVYIHPANMAKLIKA